MRILTLLAPLTILAAPLSESGLLVNTLASMPDCRAETLGNVRVQDDSPAPCFLGVPAEGGGTYHCEVVCSAGTSPPGHWVQSGVTYQPDDTLVWGYNAGPDRPRWTRDTTSTLLGTMVNEWNLNRSVRDTNRIWEPTPPTFWDTGWGFLTAVILFLAAIAVVVVPFMYFVNRGEKRSEAAEWDELEAARIRRPRGEDSRHEGPLR